MSSNHGGPRPKVREDDGRSKGRRGSPRPNAGRPPQSFTLKLGDTFTATQNQGYAFWMAWQVTEITRTHVILTDQETGTQYKLMR